MEIERGRANTDFADRRKDDRRSAREQVGQQYLPILGAQLLSGGHDPLEKWRPWFAESHDLRIVWLVGRIVPSSQLLRKHKKCLAAPLLRCFNLDRHPFCQGAHQFVPDRPRGMRDVIDLDLLAPQFDL